ncbi:ADP-ribosylation factor-like protein 6-interacting protein 4 isoform X2 [Heterodontus francisci]|uniref:ADP-ribosylation factor-like protein 6-interacting protein 4 isoform X2 n=1 Tax=Heterodontus francisci TaxID=7792 RepID=UPI00355B1A2B
MGRHLREDLQNRSECESRNKIKTKEEKRKRKRSSSNESPSASRKHSQSSAPASSKTEGNTPKKKVKRQCNLLSSSSSSSSLSSSEEDKYKKRSHGSKKRKGKGKKGKKKRKKEKKKLKKKMKMKNEILMDVRVPSEGTAGRLEEEHTVIDEQKARIQAMRPMTREEWDARQSIIRRVVDRETGRSRIIKGDGEVLEEIVSQKRHKEINKFATMGDGFTFQVRMGLNQR